MTFRLIFSSDRATIEALVNNVRRRYGGAIECSVTDVPSRRPRFGAEITSDLLSDQQIKELRFYAQGFLAGRRTA